MAEIAEVHGIPAQRLGAVVGFLGAEREAPRLAPNDAARALEHPVVRVTPTLRAANPTLRLLQVPVCVRARRDLPSPYKRWSSELLY